MIVYGVPIDRDEIDEKRDDEFHSFNPDYDRDQPYFHTGYSVSAYDPSMAVFGVELYGVSTLFNPMLLSHLNEFKPTAEQCKALKKALGELSIKAVPGIYIFEETDD